MARLNISPYPENRLTADHGESPAAATSSPAATSGNNPTHQLATLESEDAPVAPTPNDGLVYHLRILLKKSAWHLTPEQTAAVFGDKSISRRFLEALREFAQCNTPQLDFEEAVGMIQKARDERQNEKGSRGISRTADFLVPDVINAMRSARSGVVQLKKKGAKKPKGTNKAAGKFNGNTATERKSCSMAKNGVVFTNANVRQGKNAAVRAPGDANKENEGNDYDNIEDTDEEHSGADRDASVQEVTMPVNRKSGRKTTGTNSRNNGHVATSNGQNGTQKLRVVEGHPSDEGGKNSDPNEEHTDGPNEGRTDDDPVHRGRTRKRIRHGPSNNNKANRPISHQVRSNYARRHTTSTSPSVERARGAAILASFRQDLTEEDPLPLPDDDDESQHTFDDADASLPQDAGSPFWPSTPQIQHALAANSAGISKSLQASPTQCTIRSRGVRPCRPSGASLISQGTNSAEASELPLDLSHSSSLHGARDSLASHSYRLDYLDIPRRPPPPSPPAVTNPYVTSMLDEMRLVYKRKRSSIEESIYDKKHEAERLRSSRCKAIDELKKLQQSHKTSLEKKDAFLANLEAWYDWKRAADTTATASIAETLQRIVQASLDEMRDHEIKVAASQRMHDAAEKALYSLFAGRDECEQWARKTKLIDGAVLQ